MKQEYHDLSKSTLRCFTTYPLSDRKVNGNPKPIKIKGLYYSTTLGELKIKLLKNSPRTSRTMELRKEGQRLLKDHCFLMYYGIANDTTLEAFEVSLQNPEAHRENRIPLFLQLSTGY